MVYRPKSPPKKTTEPSEAILQNKTAELRQELKENVEMHSALNEQLTSLVELSTYCCAALRNLARHEESRGIIVQDGAVRVLVRAYNNSAGSSMPSILTSATSEWTREKLAFQQQTDIRNTEHPDPTERQMQQQKLIVSNVEAKVASIARLKNYSAEALLNLALHQPSADRLVQEGVAGPLVSMIGRTQAMKYEPNKPTGGAAAATGRSSSEKRHMVNAAGTLAHLARHERIKPVLVQRGAVEPLCELCR